MRALTLKHPWAFCVARWGKRIENRTWYPPKALIGQRIAIHGGKVPTSRFDLQGIRLLVDDLVKTHGLPDYEVNGDLTLQDIVDHAGIVAVATLSGTVTEAANPWKDPGSIGWVLSDVIVLPEPIPCKGAQGLWAVPADIERQIIEQIGSQLACV